MMKWEWYIGLCVGLLFRGMAMAQSNYTCELAYGLNTANNEIVTSTYGPNAVLIASNGVQDLINDYAWNKNQLYHMSFARMRNDFADWHMPKPLWYKHINKDEGPGSFNPRDSTLYFCSPANYGNAKGGFLKIYQVQKEGNGWSDPVMLPFCESKYDYAHPFFDPTQDMLVFASNREGGQGGLDIYISYWRQGNWTEPLNLGAGVNTMGNEVFPTVYKEDIYFASNQTGGMGGFDIYRALRKFQWQSCTALPPPFNSVSDDMAALFLFDEKCLITSNRSGGVGGDDIYVVQKPAAPEETHALIGRLLYQDQPLENAVLTFKNQHKELVHTTVSAERGQVDIAPIRLNQPYRVQLSEVDQLMWPLCQLQILDHSGNIIREFRFNKDGFLDLELLPFQHKDLVLWEYEDNSLLTIDLEGQLFEQVPGDIGSGEPITILDEQGIPVAIAYTNANGKFKFTDMEPQLSYNFVVAEESRARQLLLIDKGVKIVLPVLNAEANYQRLKQEEAIALRNEFDQLIYVSPKDIFVINRIYYEYKSALLTKEAQRQLDQLYLLMHKNPGFIVDLFSHTDARGSDLYNLKLSESRAFSAIQYLIRKGIDKKRLHAHGMGESQLIIECLEEKACTEPEHSINRRTEIRLGNLNH
jgi:outer membrane protein OmpA-like peptidoglycan-associated protein